MSTSGGYPTTGDDPRITGVDDAWPFVIKRFNQTRSFALTISVTYKLLALAVAVGIWHELRKMNRRARV